VGARIRHSEGQAVALAVIPFALSGTMADAGPQQQLAMHGHTRTIGEGHYRSGGRWCAPSVGAWNTVRQARGRRDRLSVGRIQYNHVTDHIGSVG